jgi:hypothetical protein
MRDVPDTGVRAPGRRKAWRIRLPGKPVWKRRTAARAGRALPWGHGGCPAAPGAGPDRKGSAWRAGSRAGAACAPGAGGRMPTGVTRGTLSFYLRVSPPRFPARTWAVCSFGAPLMEALQRLVGQQSFRLKDSLRRRPMPFAAGWGLSCCRHPKPSVNGGVSGCRGKRKHSRNTLAFPTKHTVYTNNLRPFRAGMAQTGMTARATPAPAVARPAAVPSVPPDR